MPRPASQLFLRKLVNALPRSLPKIQRRRRNNKSNSRRRSSGDNRTTATTVVTSMPLRHWPSVVEVRFLE